MFDNAPSNTVLTVFALPAASARFRPSTTTDAGNCCNIFCDKFFGYGKNAKKRGAILEKKKCFVQDALARGFKLGFTAGILDMVKGVIATLLAVIVIDNYDSSDFLFDKNVLIALTGFAAVVGHCFSIYIKFSGGKGAATFMGVLLVFSPWTALAIFVTWWVVIGVTRFTSLGNLVMVWVSLLTLTLVHDFDFGHTLLGILIAPFMYFTHRENIGRLLKGEERKLGKKVKIDETKASEEPIAEEE